MALLGRNESSSVSLQGEREETSTAAIGKYRIRGLVPHRQYTITVNQGNTRSGIMHSSPHSRELVITAEDHTGVDFIVFRQLHHFDVTGEISFDEKWIDLFDV